MDKDLEVAKETATDLLKLLMVDGTVSVFKETDSIRVDIETAQSGGLIGYHGEGLISLQLILNILMNKKTGSWQRVVVNVGDYRQKREEYLKNLAVAAATKVKNSNQPTVLLGLSSFERRIVHMVLAKDQEVVSQSEGEGQERHLVVKPKA